MILLHIVSKSLDQAYEIAEMLIDARLLVDVSLIEKTQLISKPNSKLQEKPAYMLLARTKALLFNKIDQEIQKKYKDNMPSLFSTPIVQMDWDQKNELVEGTFSV